MNGKSLGRGKPTEFPHAPHPLFLFNVGPYEPGELTARAWMDAVPFSLFHKCYRPGFFRYAPVGKAKNKSAEAVRILF